QAEDGIRDFHVTGVQTCALPIFKHKDVARVCGLAQDCWQIFHLFYGTLACGERWNAVWPVPAPRSECFVKRKHGDSVWCGKAARSEERRVGKGRRPQRAQTPEQE